MYERILVPVDGSECALQALDEAIGLAHSMSARLCLLHVAEEDARYTAMVVVDDARPLRTALRRDAERTLQSAHARAAERGVQPTLHTVVTARGRAATAILWQAQALHCDLIVMGTHGRRGMARRAMGHDAECVARQAGTPVLMVRKVVPFSLEP